MSEWHSIETAPKDSGQEVEAIAYLTRRGEEMRVVLAKFVSEDERMNGSNGWTAEPLYTSPPSPQSRVDAEDCWRPIETAPNDGTEIIARTTQEDVFACKWFDDDEDERGGYWLVYGTDEVRPREWIPMPADLKAKSPSGDRAASGTKK